MTHTAIRAGRPDNDDVVLVPFAGEHLGAALQLSQEMSWPYRLEDWELAPQLGQGFVLESAPSRRQAAAPRGGLSSPAKPDLLKSTGMVIATVAWWPYGEAHASAGMIIVAKAAQGRGCGARLVDALLAAAHPRTITLNSTAEGLALYERRGFARIGDVHQHQGVPKERHAAPSPSLVRLMAPSCSSVKLLLMRSRSFAAASGKVRLYLLLPM